MTVPASFSWGHPGPPPAMSVTWKDALVCDAVCRKRHVRVTKDARS